MHQPAAFLQCHGHFAMLAGLLAGHGQHLPFARTRRQHRHGNAHGCAIRAIHPRVVRNRHGQVRALFQSRLHHAPVEGLAQAVGGDQPHAPGVAGGHLGCGVVPPEHHKVGALGHLGPGAAQGLHIAVAQSGPHGGGANERRIPHNEIRLRPHRLPCAHIAPLRHLRGLVGHGFAGHWVRLETAPIPAGQQPTGAVMRRLQRIPRQHRVAAFDVAVVVHHRFGHAGVAVGAEVPLQKADPQHQLGQRGGALVQLDAAQLLQRHGFAFKTQLVLRLAQGFELHQHFALQALQMFQRHIQEVGAAAGWVQHAGGAELVVEFFDLGAGLHQLGLPGLAFQAGRFVRQHQRRRLRVGPVGAQWLNHGGQHQPLDIGAWRVVRAQRMALGGVECALQQRAKDGGLHFAPVGAGGFNQQVNLRRCQQQAVAGRLRAFEQFAVEVQHRAGQCRAEAASVHVGPQQSQHVLQRGRVVAVGLQQLLKGALGQQLHVFGKHAEQAAGQVRCYGFRSCWRLTGVR